MQLAGKGKTKQKGDFGQIGSAQLPHSERALGALAEGQKHYFVYTCQLAETVKADPGGEDMILFVS